MAFIKGFGLVALIMLAVVLGFIYLMLLKPELFSRIFRGGR